VAQAGEVGINENAKIYSRQREIKKDGI